MKIKLFVPTLATLAALPMLLLHLAAQDTVVVINQEGAKPALAVTDFRGAGGAQGVMNTFNGTLYGDLQNSGMFKMLPKSLYPLENPQRPEDLKPTSGKGLALGDWSGPPVSASHLVFGYTADQNGTLALYGNLFDVRQTLQGASMLGAPKRYFGTLDEAGARKVAHEFAADIIKAFGGASLQGSKIYFTSTRSGSKEIWSMDYDGSNQRQLTFNRSINIMPAVSPDGTKLAFCSFARNTPRIVLMSSDTGRYLPFYNQNASLNTTPSFTPDGSQLFYASSASGFTQIYSARIDGSNLKRISSVKAIEVEPKVNPKNPSQIAFVSGRSGPQQIYSMTVDGTDVQRLTSGEGEASNPSWHPDGKHLLFSWTRGYATGGFNVFMMDVASRQYIQLTSGAGRNENPTFAPDGIHIVFMSTRSGSAQIWTMLADGTQLQRLTSQGENRFPVWGK